MLSLGAGTAAVAERSRHDVVIGCTAHTRVLGLPRCGERLLRVIVQTFTPRPPVVSSSDNDPFTTSLEQTSAVPKGPCSSADAHISCIRCSTSEKGLYQHGNDGCLQALPGWRPRSLLFALLRFYFPVHLHRTSSLSIVLRDGGTADGCWSRAVLKKANGGPRRVNQA